MRHLTLDQFREAWYLSHVSHDPNLERDRKSNRWRGTVLTARTWKQAIERADGDWQVAACNQCLPHQV